MHVFFFLPWILISPYSGRFCCCKARWRQLKFHRPTEHNKFYFTLHVSIKCDRKINKQGPSDIALCQWQTMQTLGYWHPSPAPLTTHTPAQPLSPQMPRSSPPPHTHASPAPLSIDTPAQPLCPHTCQPSPSSHRHPSPSLHTHTHSSPGPSPHTHPSPAPLPTDTDSQKSANFADPNFHLSKRFSRLRL